MTMKEEILKRLNNADQNFDVNLAYGIKLWKSNTFYYMSKYEVVFDFFLDGIGNFMQEIHRLDEQAFTERWSIVNEFLALPCPSNALPPRIIPKMRQVFSTMEVENDQIHSKALLESFMIVAFDIKYKNFYKFDYLSYGMALKTALSYYQKYLNSQQTFNREEELAVIKRILDDIRIYVKTAGDERAWQAAFTHALTHLCEVILHLKSCGLDCHEELLELFKQVYFQDGKSSLYNNVRKQSKKHLLMSCFDPNELPIHVIALLIEGYLRAYRDMKLDVLLFLKYILLHVFVDPKRSILSDIHRIFQLTTYVFHLLKKYFIKIDQQIVQDFDFTGIFTIKLKEFLENYASSEDSLRYIFSLICTINDYNPLILETSIMDIIVRTMFIKKGPETLDKYQAMLISTVDMYIKLNRSENFRMELFTKLDAYLDENNLNELMKDLRKASKKRKLLATDEPVEKWRKLGDGAVASVPGEPDNYLHFLYPATKESSTKQIFRLHLQDQWKTLTYAWPDHNGMLSQAMLDYVKGLLTKRSFEHWHNLQTRLAEVLETLTEESTETELFKLEFVVCWMCHFFAGNTLIEHTHLFWSKLDRQFNECDNLLSTFGRLLIQGRVNESRVFGSFFKLVYFYGNYRLLVHDYRPDSIEESTNHLIHDFLKPEEWNRLEELCPPSERPLLNRVHLQKIRMLQLVEHSQDESKQLQLVENLLASDGFDQLRWLLQDRSTNFWFLPLLSLDQKVSFIGKLLSNWCFKDIEYIVAQLDDDHVLMEVILISTCKAIVQNVLSESKPSIARKFSFDDVYEFDEEKTMLRIRKLLEKKAEKRAETVRVADPHLLRKLLVVLDQLRIDEIPPERKTVIVGINLLIFADLFSCEHEDISSLHRNIFSKQLTFGVAPNMLKYFDLDTIVTIFGQSSPLMVTLVRHSAINLTEEALDSFNLHLERFSHLTDQRFELLLLIFNWLHKSNTNNRKLVPVEQLRELQSGYADAVEKFVAGKPPKKLRKSDPDMFNNLLRACSLVIRYKVVNKSDPSEELREVLLQYLDQAFKVNNRFSSTLFLNALQYRDFLKLEPDRIDQIVENRWSGFLSQVREEVSLTQEHKEIDESVIDVITKSQYIKIFTTFLTQHQPATKLTERLDQLEKEAAANKNYSTKQFVLRVYSTFAKNAFTSDFLPNTGKAFIRSFSNIVVNEIKPLCVLKKLFEDLKCLNEILTCFAALISNSKLKLVPSIMDNILDFLGSIHIKKYTVKDGEEKIFYQLHRLMSDVLYWLMLTRPNYVVNRLPHYFYVYNGLIASVICYKEDRHVENILDSFEILTLSDLMWPLEKIMSHAVKKVEKDLRIMAPYVLAQILSFVTQSKRPTTLHEKIRRNLNSICYGLISIYDKHSPNFILRTCDEASKNVYTDIVKSFRKYRSFKGKV